MSGSWGVKQVRMMQRKEPKPKAGANQKPKPEPGAKPDSAFDVWLQRGLHKLYDDVAREPVPDSLLRLIEEDRKK